MGLGINLALGNPVRADSNDGKSLLASRPRVVAQPHNGQGAETAALLAAVALGEHLRLSGKKGQQGDGKNL